MSDATFSCEVCGDISPGDPDYFCTYCHSAICADCWHGQADKGHELAEHKHEMRRKQGQYEYE
jgi:hypothetical protein